MPVHLTLEPAAQPPHAVAGALPPPAAGDRAPSRARRSARSPAKRSPSATTARSRASSRARAGCRKACSGPGERVEHQRGCAPSPGPRPTAPTPSATTGQMWLWRGETGLWEQDPATPLNFRGNLLGIAFDPNNPARGYAVGSSSVVGAGRRAAALRQDLDRRNRRCPRRSRARASPRSRSPARRRSSPIASSPSPSRTTRSSAVCSSTKAPAGASTRSGSGRDAATGVPGRSRGCPTAARRSRPSADRRARACTSAKRPARRGRPTPTPLPGSTAGQLALFREGGALRAIVTAGGDQHSKANRSAPAPGFPPACSNPSRRSPAGPESGGVLRQTATGWSDESHELNPAANRRAATPTTTCPTGPTRSSRCWSTRTARRAGRSAATSAPTNDSRPPTSSAIPPTASTPLGRGAQVAGAAATRRTTRPSRSAAGRSARLLRRPRGRGDRTRRVALAGARTRAARSACAAFLYTGPRVTTAETPGSENAADPVRAGARALRADPRRQPDPGLRGDLAVRPRRAPGKRRHRGDVRVGVRRLSRRCRPRSRPATAPNRRCGETRRLPVRLLRVRLEGTGGAVRVIVLDDSARRGRRRSAMARRPARGRQGERDAGDRRRQRRPERADRSRRHGAPRGRRSGARRQRRLGLLLRLPGRKRAEAAGSGRRIDPHASARARSAT